MCSTLTHDQSKQMKARTSLITANRAAKMKAALKIQTHFRGFLAREHAKTRWLIRHKVAYKIQQIWRAFARRCLNDYDGHSREVAQSSLYVDETKRLVQEAKKEKQKQELRDQMAAAAAEQEEQAANEALEQERMRLLGK